MAQKRIVVITGDTGVLGRHLVKLFIVAEDMVVGISRSSVAQQQFEDYVHITADIKTNQDALLASIVKTYGIPDVFINNATAFVHKKLEDTTIEEYREIQDVNVTAPFLFLQALTSYYKKDGFLKNILANRSIINIGSASMDFEIAKKSEELLGAYAMAKAGMALFSTVAAKELFEYGVRVNMLAPAHFTGDAAKITLLAKKCYAISKSRENGILVPHTALME